MELNTNKKTNYRWIVCGFLWVAVAVNYVDRTALSAATPIIMKEFNIDGTEMGIIMAAFFWAYALFFSGHMLCYKFLWDILLINLDNV